MKNRIKLSGRAVIIVLAAIMGISTASCPNTAGGSGGGDLNTQTEGRMTITGLPERYNNQFLAARSFNSAKPLIAGDDIFWTNGSLKTRGEMVSVSGPITLKVWMYAYSQIFPCPATKIIYYLDFDVFLKSSNPFDAAAELTKTSALKIGTVHAKVDYWSITGEFTPTP